MIPYFTSANEFYEDPYSIRQQALTAEYNGNISVNSFLNKEAVDKLSYMLNTQVEPVLVSGHFKKTLAGNEFDGIDACSEADYIAIVYLTLPIQAEGEQALSLYRHLKNGSEKIPSAVEMQLQGFNNLLEVKESYLDIDGQYLDRWQPWFTAYQRWNRVVLFNARCWHRELEGFGDSINNCRLSQLFYLRVR